MDRDNLCQTETIKFTERLESKLDRILTIENSHQGSWHTVKTASQKHILKDLK